MIIFNPEFFYFLLFAVDNFLLSLQLSLHKQILIVEVFPLFFEMLYLITSLLENRI